VAYVLTVQLYRWIQDIPSHLAVTSRNPPPSANHIPLRRCRGLEHQMSDEASFPTIRPLSLTAKPPGTVNQTSLRAQSHPPLLKLHRSQTLHAGKAVSAISSLHIADLRSTPTNTSDITGCTCVDTLTKRSDSWRRWLSSVSQSL
jgi:hypothetical protein